MIELVLELVISGIEPWIRFNIWNTFIIFDQRVKDFRTSNETLEKERFGWKKNSEPKISAIP